MTQTSRKTPRSFKAERAQAPAKGARAWLRASLGVLVVGFLVFAGHLVWLARDLPDTSALEIAPPAGAAMILDREGRLVASRGERRGRPLTAQTLPPLLVDAVLAVEDRRFYDHAGVDLRGMARAGWANIRAGRIVQGGSTITQQLAKNLFLTPERTYRRKMQEIMLAFWLERRFTKDEILALYLNRVYFGAGAWGADAAAWRYFGRAPQDLSLGQAAMLAGLLKAPSRYSPVADPRRAAVRATVVLDLMVDDGRISEAERQEAAETPIRVSRGAASAGSGWFADWVYAQARALVGENAGDIIVRTSLDLTAQRAAEAAVRDGLALEAAGGAGQAALVAIDGGGAVRALVGGRDYASAPFNRAVHARRQPGSAFKPFVYTAALETGLRPDAVFIDEPVRFGDWAPENYGGRYEGAMTARRAFARSSNAVAAQIAEETGRHYILDAARRLGIESPLENTRALALGAYEVTPIELAAAYAPFMNGGVRVEPYAIERIETAGGAVLYERSSRAGGRILAERVAAEMRQLLGSVVQEGTGQAAAAPGRAVYGKTGTTNDFRDAWFVGWSDDLAAAVWIGHDDGSATEGAVGGGAPAQIFRSFIEGAAPRDGPAEPDAQAVAGDPIAALLADLEETP